MLVTLQKSGFSMQGEMPLDIYNPIWVSSYMRQNELLPLPGIEAISASSTFEEIRRRFPQFSSFKKPNDESFVLDAVPALSEESLMILTFDLGLVPRQVRDSAWARLKQLTGSTASSTQMMVEIAKLSPVPAMFYSAQPTCEGIAGARGFLEQNFSVVELVVNARRVLTVAKHIYEAETSEGALSIKPILAQYNECLSQEILKQYDRQSSGF
jgi:hypothetical protein